MLSSLPVELLLKIGNEIGQLKDWKNLRLTCQSLDVVFQSLVLQNISVDIFHGHLEPGISFLEALNSDRASSISQHVRTLCLRRLAPFYSPESDVAYEERLKSCHYAHEVANKARVWVRIDSQTPEDVIAEARLFNILGPALKSLHNLRALRYFHSPGTKSDWAVKTILDSLSSPGLRQSLREFESDYASSWSEIFEPLLNLPHLESLSLSKMPRHSFPANKPNIARSSTLKKFRLILHDDGTIVPLCIRIPEHITHLGLAGFYISKPSRIIQKNLVSLEVGEMRCMKANQPHNLGELWLALAEDEIHLRELVITRTDDAIDALFKYLRSYSGLKTLSIQGPSIYTGLAYDHVGRKFFADILPMHSNTLVRLEVKPAFEGSWCFGRGNMGSFRECRNLQSLSVSLNYSADRHMSAIFWQEDFRMQALLDSTQALINTVSSSMPELERLTLEPTRSQRRIAGGPNLMSGAEYYLLVRRALCISLEALLVGDRSWVDMVKAFEVYIGRERFATSSQRGKAPTKERRSVKVRKSLDRLLKGCFR